MGLAQTGCRSGTVRYSGYAHAGRFKRWSWLVSGTELLWTNVLGFCISGVFTVAAWRTGSHHRHGWLLFAFGEAAWVGYGFLLQQWTVMAWSVIHTSIYMRNWVRNGKLN